MAKAKEDENVAELPIVVKADVQGTLPEGYEIENVVCSPAAVTVRGPSTKLETVEAVRTAPIDLEGRLQSFRIRKPLTPPAAARNDACASKRSSD